MRRNVKSSQKSKRRESILNFNRTKQNYMIRDKKKRKKNTKEK
jgi:hypothetical protein